MARTVLAEEAVEGGSFVVAFGFVDENGAAVTPAAAMWSLVDEFGTVINGRSEVALALAPTVEIVLGAGDLQWLGAMDSGVRRVVVEASYFSAGTLLALVDEVEFRVRALSASAGLFSYDLTATDATAAAVARVRLEIGDTVAGVGVLPDGRNLTDGEIGVYLAQYGSDVTATVAAVARMLARRWATLADVTVGPRSEKLSQVALAWERQAAGAVSSQAGAGSFVMQPVRVDGYSAAATE